MANESVLSENESRDQKSTEEVADLPKENQDPSEALKENQDPSDEQESRQDPPKLPKDDQDLPEQKEPPVTKKDGKKRSEKRRGYGYEYVSEEENEPASGLFDCSTLQEGPRERKKIERLSFAPDTEKKKILQAPDGKGTKLGDIPIIVHMLSRAKSEALRPLHHLIFKTFGTAQTIRKNLRSFNGYSFDADSEEYAKKLEKLEKMTMAELKVFCNYLGLERGGGKEELIKRMLDFLLNPQDNGKSVPEPKKKKSKSGGKKRKSKSTKNSGEKPAKRVKRDAKDDDDENEEADDDDDDDADGSSSGSATENDDENNDDDDSDVDEKKTKKSKSIDSNESASEEEDDNDDDDDDDYGKKRKSVTKKKKSPPPKKAATNGKTPVKPKPKAQEKPTPKVRSSAKPKPKKAAPPPPKKLVDEADISSDSDDEPLAAKKKPTAPTDKELKSLVEDLLKDADLETVTMKSVLKQVYGKFPLIDLSHKKDFLKTTVKAIIS